MSQKSRNIDIASNDHTPLNKTENKEVSLWKIFSLFAKIGTFTIGGGYAMVPIIEREVVEKRRWLDTDTFADTLAIAQSAPGILAVNISIFVGYKLRGNKGSIFATIGTCLPSFLFILLIAMFFANFRSNIYVDKIFKGIRPVVVALIAVPVVNMIRSSSMNLYKYLLVGATTIAIIFLKVSPVIILIAVALCFFGVRWIKYKNNKDAGNV